MPDVQHKTIGQNVRTVKVEQEEKEQRKEELFNRFMVSPVGFRFDQLSVWVLWASLAAGVFLYCTVKAVVLAVS